MIFKIKGPILSFGLYLKMQLVKISREIVGISAFAFSFPFNNLLIYHSFFHILNKDLTLFSLNCSLWHYVSSGNHG